MLPTGRICTAQFRLALSVEPHVGSRKQDMDSGMQRLERKSSCQPEVREAPYTTTLSFAWDLYGVDGMWLDEDGPSVEWCWEAKAKVQREKPVLVLVLWSLQQMCVCVCVCVRTFSPHYTRISGVSQEPDALSFNSYATRAVRTSTLKRKSSFLPPAVFTNFMEFWKWVTITFLNNLNQLLIVIVLVQDIALCLKYNNKKLYIYIYIYIFNRTQQFFIFCWPCISIYLS